MHSRSQIAWHEYQNKEEYKQYYESNATLAQALLYIAYGLLPMSDKWHRIKRKIPIYNLNKSKEAKILDAKDQLFTALLQSKLQARGNKGVGKALEHIDKEGYHITKQYLCTNHESNTRTIPSDFWDPLYTNIDKNYAFIPGEISYINITIPTKKLFRLFPYEYKQPEIHSPATKAHTNEEIEFLLFAARYFFDQPENLLYTKSAKRLAFKLQEKYKEITGRNMSDNKAKVLTSVLKNEHINEKMCRKIQNS